MGINLKKAAILVCVLIGISATTINNDRLYEISKNIEIFVNVYKELNANYVDDIDPTQLMRTGIDAMVESLDPYTNYISESQVASYRISTDGKYQGIGAIVRKVDDYITIIEPYQDGPVVEAGLKAGDQIIAVQGRSTKGKSTEDMNQVLRGIPGSAIQLTIKRPSENKEFDVDLMRSQVNIPNVPYAGIVGDNIGYVVLTTFTANAGKNIRKEINRLKNETQGLKGVILDLRNNGGGLLREAISVSNIFIPQNKQIVSVKSKVQERDQTYKTMGTPLDLEIPVVVLINKSSASASEIVSGVLQDLDRAVVIGQRSYGKGLVQNTMEVGYNSRVKVTTSKYYIPSGRCIQSVEYKDGEPVDIPDEKRAKFKTAAGRTVLDGGGVTPDIILKNGGTPEIIQQLEQDHILFKYINKIESNYKQDTSLDVQEFNFNDFLDFKSFVKQSDFDFKSKNEELLEQIKENLKEEGQTALASEVTAFETKISEEADYAMEQHKQKIIDTIEEEIAARKRYQRGKSYQRLQNDTEIEEAIAIINDQARYKKVLGK